MSAEHSAGLIAALFAVFSSGIVAWLQPAPGPVDAAPGIAMETRSLMGAMAPGSPIGALSLVDVVEWRSSDRRFGGWSDLRHRPDGGLWAVSDQGYWLDLKDGVARITALRDETGATLSSKQDADAEGLVLTADARALVSFEGRHRIVAYDVSADGGPGPAQPGPALDGIARLGGNSGLEALALTPDGRLVAGAESGEIWVSSLDPQAQAAPLNQKLALPFGWGLTAMGIIDDHVLMVWRAYNPLSGQTQIDVRRCARAGLDAPPLTCRRLALLAAPFPVDNFEALDVQRRESGYRLTLLSDDNYNRRQRTIYAVFDWDGATP